MNNFQVYKRTLVFSFIRFFLGLLCLAVLAGLTIGGFFIMEKTNNKGLIGLAIGLVAGIIICVLVNIFVDNRFKAAQIGMMATGVVDGKLPDHVVSAGLGEVKGRFAKLTLFFMVTGAIKGIFRQIGRGLDKLGRAVGGDVGEGITSAINTAIQILLEYLCDCCLGWVMYNKKEGVAKAACQGAVIFFKHGKALIRNVGRIFGMGFLSLAIFGGGFFGIAYLISKQFPNLYVTLAKEITEFGTRQNVNIAEWVKDPNNLMLILSGVVGLVLWGMIHSLLIRPFILVGVLRNFMTAGLKDKPTEKDFDELASKSPKFAKLQKTI
ncbi:MAG: hypothetical protein IJU60_02555 [Acholeplasmatales bacterium]|nr:hypothetical protein [Acholeplasmatales bacterium]